MRPLNLARRPFRNERLQTLGMATATVVLLGLTVWHGFVVRDLLPRRTSSLHNEVAELEKRLKLLREERRSIRVAVPEARTLAQWTRVKELVDQRMFSWTDLFASLEEVIPDGVRLVSIAPRVAKGDVEINLSAMVRTRQDGWDFWRVLEDHPEFSNVFPTSESEADTGLFNVKMGYRSSAAWRAGRAAALAAGVAAEKAKAEETSVTTVAPGETGAAATATASPAAPPPPSKAPLSTQAVRP